MEMQNIFCPRCGAKLTVPVNAGKLRVICSHCRHGFAFDSGPRAGTPPKTKKRWWLVAIIALVAVTVLLNLGRLIDAVPSGGPAGYGSSAVSDDQNNRITSRSGFFASWGTSEPSVSQPQRPQVSARERAREIIPYFDLRYYLCAMDDDALQAACDLYEAAMHFDEAVVFTAPVEETLFDNIFRIMGDECPELFQVDYSSSFKVLRDRDGNYTKCWIPYRFTQGKYQDMRGACEEVISGFIRATAGRSDCEKEKYVFDEIVSRDQYDVNAQYADTAYGALVDRRAKCDGFSYALKWAMESMGIQCLYVSGDPTAGQELGHAWNIIRLGGRYYRVDLTVSVPMPGQETYGFEGIRYIAFNVSDGMAAEEDTQYAIRPVYSYFAPVPACTRVDMNHYVLHGGFIPAGEDYYAVLTEWATLLVPDGGYFYAQFESNEAYNRYTGGEYDKLLLDVLNTQTGRYWYQTVWYGYNCIGIRIWHE